MRVKSVTRVVVAMVVMLAGCGTSGATGSGSPGEVTTTPPTSPASAASPGIPKGFPVFAGAQPVTPLPSEAGLVARWRTEANGAALYGFYVDALPTAGFSVQQLLPGGAAAIIRFTGPDGVSLSLSLTGSGGGTQIDLERAEAGP
jgi:hypothetical protein